MHKIAVVLGIVLAAGAGAFAAYESTMGIKVIPTHLYAGKPVNFKFRYDFSHGLTSLGGTWKAYSGGGKSDGATLVKAEGMAERERGAKFGFTLKPGGDTWALLAFKPGPFSPIDLKEGDGIYFRARSNGAEMDGFPARWYLQVRIRLPGGRAQVLRTPDFEVLSIWQSFYVSADDLGGPSSAGLFAEGRKKARVIDLSLIPNVEKYRAGWLTLDDLTVWTQGRKIPGLDTDGDGIPDFVDGDDDNDGVYDFAQAAHDKPLIFRKAGYVLGGGRWEGRFEINRRRFAPGEALKVTADLRVESREISRAVNQLPEIVGLLVGERRYDDKGDFHTFSNHLMSSLLTPAGFPIENYQTQLPSRHIRPTTGVIHTSPIDLVSRVPRPRVRVGVGEIFLRFEFDLPITEKIPPGHWWLYFEFGVIDQHGSFVRLDSLPIPARRAGIGLAKESPAGDDNLTFEKKTILPMIRIGSPET
ncbi:MAG: hypothetical protein ACYTFG_19165, partial [Planctomycetota bacterium]